jgi:hypothetical protein
MEAEPVGRSSDCRSGQMVVTSRPQADEETVQIDQVTETRFPSTRPAGHLPRGPLRSFRQVGRSERHHCSGLPRGMPNRAKHLLRFRLR